MNAPRRLLDEGGGSTPFERSILRTGADVEPPPDAKEAIFAALAAKLPIGGSMGASTALNGAAGASTSAASTAGSAGKTMLGAGGIAALVKALLIGAGVATMIVVGYAGLAGRTSAPKSAPAAETGSISAATAAAAREEAPRAEESAAPNEPKPADADDAKEPSTSSKQASNAAAKPSAAVSAPPSALDLLKAESAMIAEARDSLRRGNTSGALAVLAEIPRKFPHAQLGQEREALTIEALYRSGNTAAASERAKAFLKANPSSPHASRIESFVQQ